MRFIIRWWLSLSGLPVRLTSEICTGWLRKVRRPLPNYQNRITYYQSPANEITSLCQIKVSIKHPTVLNIQCVTYFVESVTMQSSLCVAYSKWCLSKLRIPFLNQFLHGHLGLTNHWFPYFLFLVFSHDFIILPVWQLQTLQLMMSQMKKLCHT